MQGKFEKARRRAFEFVMRSEITFQQRRVSQDMSLPYSPFHRSDLVRQSSAAVGNLCGLINCLSAVISKPINGKRIVDEGNDKRKTDKRKTEQDQFEKRLRVAQTQHGPCAGYRLLPCGFCTSSHLSTPATRE